MLVHCVGVSTLLEFGSFSWGLCPSLISIIASPELAPYRVVPCPYQGWLRLS